MSYTTSDLINSVQIRAMIPDASSGSLSPANLLQLATEELQSVIVPMILSAREKYYETSFSQSLVAGQSTYAIPTRAIGGIISVVQYVYNQGVYVLQPIDPDQQGTTQTIAYPTSFYFQNNSIVLYPTPNQAVGTLVMRYYQRPSRLDLVSNAALITAVNAGAQTVTVASVPSTWTSGTVVDFIPGILPYTPYGLNTAILSVSGTTVSFTALPTGVAVGDYLDLAEFTPIPEVPQEFFVVLSQATAVKALEAVGDVAKIGQAQQQLESYANSALKLITPRDVHTPKKVVSSWRNW